MYRLALELRKVGRQVDAKYTETEAVKFARRFSHSDAAPMYADDAQFLLKLAGKRPPQTAAAGQEEADGHGLPGLGRSSSEGGRRRPGPRPKKNWAD